MIAVAIVGLGLGAAVGAFRMRRTAALHLSRATEHARQEIVCLKSLQRLADEEHEAIRRDREIRSRPTSSVEDAESLRRVAEANEHLLARIRDGLASCARRYDYHSRMRRRYEDAASRPWRSVSPDPAPE